MAEFIRFVRFFYGLVGLRSVALLLLMGAAALSEVVAMSMFMPLLEQNDIDNQMGRAIARVFETIGLPYTFTSVLVLMIGFYFITSAFLILKTMYVARLVTGLLVDLRVRLVDRLFSADYQYFLKKDIGYLNNAVVVEYARVAFAFEDLADVLVGVVFAVAYLAVPLGLNPVIVVILAIFGAPAIIAIRKINLETRRSSIERSAHSARLQEFLIQALHNYKYLKSTFSHHRILAQVNQAADELGRVLYRLWVLAGLSHYGFTPFTIVAVSALLYIQVQIRGLPLVDTLFVLYLLQRSFGRLLGIQINYRRFLSSFGGIDVLQRLEREVSLVQEDLRPGGVSPDFDQPIRLKGVSFGYGAGDYVLRNIELEVPPKSTVAFVGVSGAGKSTLVTLLTGILSPSEGDITLGEHSYGTLDQGKLRAGIGFVTQEGVIFNDTIENNITLWSNGNHGAEVAAAARNARIDQFVARLPERYESTLGTDGLKISGGQRQRINIARELFKDVSLLLFDEATSSLDSESERTIQSNLEEFHGKKTMVLIAHRVSTVKNADVIFVLKDGRIVQQGKFEELYNEEGEFRRLVDVQMIPSPNSASEPADKY